MSNQGQAVAQTTSEEESQISFEDKVSKAVDETKKDGKGKDVLPEGIDAEVKIAASAELRRRHTQGQYSTSQQKLKVSEAENDKLRQLLVPQLNLSTEKKEELHDLKSTDPDAWRAELDKLEGEARTKLNEDLATISSDASQEAEKERRAQVLENFLTTNPELVLNDEVLTNDIPPRIKNKLEQGKVTFEEFLTEAKDFLTANKKIGDGNDTEKEPNLNNSGGGDKATVEATQADMSKSYANEIY